MREEDKAFAFFMNDVHSFEVGIPKSDEMISKILSLEDVDVTRQNHLKYDSNSRGECTDEQVVLYDKAYIEGYNAGYKQCMLSRWAYENNKKPGKDFKFGDF